MTLRGHAKRLTALALSGDGNRLFTGSSFDKTVKAWDLAAEENVMLSPGHIAAVTGLVVSGDGKFLFSGSYDSTIKICDVAAGTEIATLRGHKSSVLSLALSPSGSKLQAQRLYSGSANGSIKIWDLSKNEEIMTFQAHDDDVHCLVISAGGDRLFSAGKDKRIKIWNPETGAEILKLSGHTGEVLRLAAAADGKKLYSGGKDKTIRVWDLTAAKEVQTLRSDAPISNLAISRDGKRLFAEGGDSIRVWDLETGKPSLPLRGPAGSASTNSLVLIERRQTALPGQHQRHHQQMGPDRRQARCRCRPIWGGLTAWPSAATAAGSSRAALQSRCRQNDPGLEPRNRRGGFQPARAHSGKRRPDPGNHRPGRQRRRQNTLPASGPAVKLWDLTEGKDILTLAGFGGTISSLIVRDNRLLAGVALPGGAGTVEVWNLQTQDAVVLRTAAAGKGLAVDAAGRRMFVGGADGSIETWSLNDNQRLGVFQRHGSAVSGLAVSADGNRLYSAGSDRTIKVWDLKTAKEIETLRGHLAQVTRLRSALIISVFVLQARTGQSRCGSQARRLSRSTATPRPCEVWRSVRMANGSIQEAMTTPSRYGTSTAARKPEL